MLSARSMIPYMHAEQYPYSWAWVGFAPSCNSPTSAREVEVSFSGIVPWVLTSVTNILNTRLQHCCKRACCLCMQASQGHAPLANSSASQMKTCDSSSISAVSCFLAHSRSSAVNFL